MATQTWVGGHALFLAAGASPTIASMANRRRQSAATSDVALPQDLQTTIRDLT